MRTYLYKIATFCLLTGFFLTGWAQPTVDVCLRKTATKLEIVLTPDAAFTGLVSNIQLTIRCSDPTVTYGTPGDLQFYCSMAKGGDVTVTGGVVYQKFGGIGFLTLSALGTSWTSGTDIVLFSVVPSSLTPVFEIVNNSWTAANNGAYYVELNAVDKTGLIGTCGTALPIDGLQLDADQESGGAIKLNWSTEREENGSTFTVLKRGENNRFKVLGEVAASGMGSYQFEDKTALYDVNYYQIRQINPDGSDLLSNIVEIRNDGDMGMVLYPNPSPKEAFIEFGEINDTEKHITVHNNMGQLLMDFTSTDTSIRLDVSSLAEGLYHVKVTEGERLWEKSLIKVSE